MTTPEQIALVKSILHLYYGQGIGEDQADALRALLREREEQAQEIHKLRASMVEHFSVEHLQGDGPEIDRWKRKLCEAQRDIERLKVAAFPGITNEVSLATKKYVEELERARLASARDLKANLDLRNRVAELEAQLQAEREQLAAEQRRADRISRILSEARSRLCLPSGEIAKVPDEISRWAIGKGELQDRLAAEIEARKRAEGQLARSLVPVKRLEEMLQAAEEKLRRLREAAEFACEEHEKECGTQCAGCSGMVELSAALLADQKEEPKLCDGSCGAKPSRPHYHGVASAADQKKEKR